MKFYLLGFSLIAHKPYIDSCKVCFKLSMIFSVESNEYNKAS